MRCAEFNVGRLSPCDVSLYCSTNGAEALKVSGSGDGTSLERFFTWYPFSVNNFPRRQDRDAWIFLLLKINVIIGKTEDHKIDQ